MLAVLLIPSHVNEGTEPVDNSGGMLSIVIVASLVLAINFAPVPNRTTITLVLFGRVARWRRCCFLMRQRRARNPLYDLDVASRRVFWVAALAGIIVFGSLMGAMFIGQQFLQNVLGYSTLDAGLRSCRRPSSWSRSRPARRSSSRRAGARFTLLVGYVFCMLGFLTMLLLWEQGIPTGRSGSATPSSAPGSASPAPPPRTR